MTTLFESSSRLVHEHAEYTAPACATLLSGASFGALTQTSGWAMALPCVLGASLAVLAVSVWERVRLTLDGQSRQYLRERWTVRGKTCERGPLEAITHVHVEEGVQGRRHVVLKTVQGKVGLATALNNFGRPVLLAQAVSTWLQKQGVPAQLSLSST